MKMTRYILCTERAPLLRQASDESIWILPREMDWTSSKRSFDLLGTTHMLERENLDKSSMNGPQEHDRVITLLDFRSRLRLEEELFGVEPSSHGRVPSTDPEEVVRGKLVQLLHAMWLVFGYEPMTIDQGIRWLGPETVKRLLVIAEVFALLERKRNIPLGSELLWQHSLRTGCLAGFLAKEEHGDSGFISQSCVAGFSHDIGLAIFAVSLDSTQYLDVLACARRQSVSLATAELLEFGFSHEIVGAEYLQRQKFPKAIIDAVSFHDNPLGFGVSGFTPTLAVYAANILDGGGWPQDSDGIPSDRAIEYLSSQGFVDPWPKWQRYVGQLHHQEFRRA